MPKKPKKGSFGYIKDYKIYRAIISAIWILLILAVYISGLIIYGTNKNYVTILAVLMVLPAAKAWIASIVMIPYHSVSKDLYQNVLELMEEKDARVYADMVLTKYEGSMALSLVVNYDDNFYAFVPKQKKTVREIQAYLNTILQNSGTSTIAQVFDNETKYLNEIKRLAEGPELEGKKMKVMEQNLFSAAL